MTKRRRLLEARRRELGTFQVPRSFVAGVEDAARAEPASLICTDCGKWVVWSGPGEPLRGRCGCGPN